MEGDRFVSNVHKKVWEAFHWKVKGKVTLSLSWLGLLVEPPQKYMIKYRTASNTMNYFICSRHLINKVY